ncbi:MAG: inorganic phosphate transporter [Desulfovibrio sp.]|jgi:PiT family inorganic phosphate transporter|nr:inorganic phosphate transporter [Desulfovibrio sp.]
MEFTHGIFIAAVLGGFLMAFSLGANDVANSMAAAVGAKAISLRQAVIIAALLNFIGAVFLGSQVAATICRGIINPDVIHNQSILMIGMFAALLSSGLWVLIATCTALPVSSTHSIVGSIVGFGLIAGGPDVVQWWNLIGVIVSWIVSPFFGALISFIVFVHIRGTILYSRQIVRSAIRWAPFWIAVTLAIIILSFCYKTPYGRQMHLAGWQGICLALLLAAVSMLVLRHYLPKLIEKDMPEGTPRAQVEGVFRRMQVGTACYVALSQGANDVANAIGPVIAIYFIATQGSMAGQLDIPVWLLIMGGLGIASGIFCLGYKVMGTVGERITKINNSRGFAVAFGSATTVLMASNLGLPVSTTHAAVGSVVGVGLARGFHAVDFRVLAKILLFWVLTVPIAGFSCIIIFQILRWSFLD